MKTSSILLTSWFNADPRRAKMVFASVAAILMLVGLGTGYEEALAGKATTGPH